MTLDLREIRNLTRWLCRRVPQLRGQEEDVFQEVCIAKLTGRAALTQGTLYAHRMCSGPIASRSSKAPRLSVDFKDFDQAVQPNAEACVALGEIKRRLPPEHVEMFLRHATSGPASRMREDTEEVLARDYGLRPQQVQRILYRCRKIVRRYQAT